MSGARNNVAAQGVSGGATGGAKRVRRKKSYRPIEHPTEDWKVVSVRGVTRLVDCNVDVSFKFRNWVLKLNPKLKPLGLRKDLRKKIYVNGRKFGWGESAEGVVPLSYAFYQGEDFNVKFVNFLRRAFGYKVASAHLGYLRIKLRKHSYIVTKSIMPEGHIRCTVWYEKPEEQMGIFIITNDYKRVIVHFPEYGLTDSVAIIVAFTLDSMLYMIAADRMTVCANFEKSPQM